MAGQLLHETGIMHRLLLPDRRPARGAAGAERPLDPLPVQGRRQLLERPVGDRVAENAIWTYREPLAEAQWLRGYASIYPEMVDTWVEEDEQLPAFLRDPYHRIDARPSSRAVQITHGDRVVAASANPVTLFETGVPTRFYLAKEDLRDAELEPSETRSICQYKGEATYWSLQVDGETLDDAAWSLEEPLEGAHAARGRVCFLHEELELEAEGGAA